MKNVVVDYESYYDKELSVTEIGLHNYVRQTDAYLVSVVSDDLEFVGGLADYEKHLGTSWMQDPNLQFWAANSNFDQKWSEKYWPKTARPWKCVLDKAAYHQLPRNLAGVCKSLLGRHVDKKVRDEMKGVRYEELPEARQKQVSDYCLSDGINEWDVLNKLGPMSSMEEEVAEHTRLCNRRGVHIDMEKVERDVDLLERLKFESIKKIPWAEEAKPLSKPAFDQWCQGFGWTAPKSLDKRGVACAQFMKEHPEAEKIIKMLRTIRGSSAKLKKVRRLLANVCDGVFPLELLYCGARHTRRWSSKGFNVQNLDGDRVFGAEMDDWQEFEDEEEEDCGIFMREYLIPPPGCIFGILDFAQIEPRVLNWLAGNEPMLAQIRNGMEIYEAYGRSALGYKDPGKLKEVNNGLRRICKVHVLSGGFAGGAGAFGNGARKEGLNYSEAELEAQVQLFRDNNPLIRKFWAKMKVLISAALNDNSHSLEIEMPTGDKLKHFHIRRQLGKNKGFPQITSTTVRGEFTKQSIIPNLWHGLLTENVTQRMARDILAEAILRLEKSGFPVIFHAHDEVILALPIQGAESALEEAKRVMSIPPDWCADLPIGVSGDLSPHYTKFK